MNRGRHTPAARRIACASLALVLLFIAAYVFSGFHLHDPLSNKVCAFSQVERGASLAPGCVFEFQPVMECHWRGPDGAAPSLPFAGVPCAGGRAPPLFS